MNRLTLRLPDDLGAVPKLGYGWPEIAERLAAYEDTGLEPEEIMDIPDITAIESELDRYKCAEAEGRLLVLDRETALAIAAGWRAIRTTKKLHGASFVYDPFGEDGGPYEIPYLKAMEILCNIWDKYPLDGEDAEKALEGMKNDEC